jgi:hypothetical protein
VRPNAGLDGFDGLYAEMLRAFRPLAKAGDPLEVEVFASELVGAWWQRLPPGEDPETVFGLGAVEHAARAGTREGLALLRALAVVGVTGEQREAASTAAAAMAAAGVADPQWAGRLGRVHVGECWRLADVYGDQASLLMVFDYGQRRHGLVALVDFNHLGGWVKDLFVTAEPARTLRELRKAALSEPLARLEQVDPAAARGLLEDGLAATDATWQPEMSQELRQYRALALARCRAMPEPPKGGPDREIGEAEREAVVDDFLASAQAVGLPDGDAARYCARLLVDFGADYDDGKLLRVSPAKVERFLLDWLPAKVMLDDEDRDAVPAVVAAWVRWAGDRTGLPAAALSELAEVASICSEQFGEVYEDAADAAGRARADRSAKAATAGRRDAVYQVKVSLRGARPPIWRRLRLPAAATLGDVHDVIQAAFGWTDSHLHAFEVGGRRYSHPDFGLSDLEDRFADEAKARLCDVVPASGGRLRYTYDFGDGWEHELVVEEILPSDGVPHAVCVAGRRAGPPEDCGGVWGYADLLDILADPGHPEHAERHDWLGYEHDPAAFDKDAINLALSDLRLP